MMGKKKKSGSRGIQNLITFLRMRFRCERTCFA